MPALLLNLCVTNWNEKSLTQLVPEAFIVLWLLYCLLSSRYLAPLNSLKWYVDSENTSAEQTATRIQRSDCTASNPFLGSGHNGDSEGKMDAWTKDLDVRQRASAPEVSLDVHAGVSPCSVFTSLKKCVLIFSSTWKRSISLNLNAVTVPLRCSTGFCTHHCKCDSVVSSLHLELKYVRTSTNYLSLTAHFCFKHIQMYFSFRKILVTSLTLTHFSEVLKNVFDQNIFEIHIHLAHLSGPPC